MISFFQRTKKKRSKVDKSLTIQVRDFLISAGRSYFKINDEMIAESYPETYLFFERNSDKWRVGRFTRTSLDFEIFFQIEEEALMTLVLYVLYGKIVPEKRLEYLKELRKLQKEKKIPFINEVVQIEKIDISKLEIVDGSYILYNKQKILPRTEQYEIEKLYLMFILKLAWHEKYTNEMIEFGIDEAIVRKYFTIEKTFDKFYSGY